MRKQEETSLESRIAHTTTKTSSKTNLKIDIFIPKFSFQLFSFFSRLSFHIKKKFFFTCTFRVQPARYTKMSHILLIPIKTYSICMYKRLALTVNINKRQKNIRFIRPNKYYLGHFPVLNISTCFLYFDKVPCRRKVSRSPLTLHSSS